MGTQSTTFGLLQQGGCPSPSLRGLRQLPAPLCLATDSHPRGRPARLLPLLPACLSPQAAGRQRLSGRRGTEQRGSARPSPCCAHWQEGLIPAARSRGWGFGHGGHGDAEARSSCIRACRWDGMLAHRPARRTGEDSVCPAPWPQCSSLGSSGW